MLAIAASLIALGPTAYADILTFQQGDGGSFSTTASTWIQERYGADDNFGNQAVVSLNETYRASTHILTQGLVGFFDVIGAAAGQIPAGATINSATLTMKSSSAANSGGGTGKVEAHKMLKSWNQSEATWTNLKNGSPFGSGTFTAATGNPVAFGGGAVAVDFTATVLDSQTVSDGNSVPTVWNVTSAVQNWANGDTNAGFYLLYKNNNAIELYSDNATTQSDRPLLTVDYTDPNPDVILTASSPTGATVLQPGNTFDIDLTWTGPKSAVATDYAVTLNTSQLLLTGRTANGALTPYVDTPYHSAFPVATDHVDVTWYKESGFAGKDVILHFQVPANYTGPSVITVNLAIARAEDGSANELKGFTNGTTLNANQYDPQNPYAAWAVTKNLTAANNAPGSDADSDGYNNLTEFAFNGDPLNGSNNGLFYNQLVDTPSDGDTDKELTFTCAVRSGAVFSANANNAQVSAAIDGVIYTIEGSSTLTGAWTAPIVNLGASVTPPVGSGLPNPSGSGWEYRTFSGFNGIPLKGFIHAGVSTP